MTDTIRSAPPAVRVAVNRRLDSLTGMRFFAAVPVVLIHVGGQFAQARWLSTVDGLGYLGVSFFFVISGFVLTWSCARQPARRFWWLRVARVWPSQFLVALFAMTVLAAQERIPGWFGRAADLLLLQAWWPNQQVYYGGNGVSWSLSDELFFYLLFPLAVIPVRRMGCRGLLVTAGAALAVMAGAPLVASSAGVSATTYAWLFFVFPPYRFAEFLLGMLLARAAELGLRAPGWAGPGALIGLVAMVCGMTVYTMRSTTVIQRPFATLLVLPFVALLLLACATQDLRSRRWWLNSWPLLRLGEWSFALYLVHKPVFLLTSRWHWWDNSGGLSTLATFITYLALAIGVAAAVHYLVEKPIERRLRRLRPPSRKDTEHVDRDRGGADARAGRSLIPDTRWHRLSGGRSAA
jgi:peptidoglycan/LPS O-acetylase OafA/YrhL